MFPYACTLHTGVEASPEHRQAGSHGLIATKIPRGSPAVQRRKRSSPYQRGATSCIFPAHAHALAPASIRAPPPPAHRPRTFMERAARRFVYDTGSASGVPAASAPGCPLRHTRFSRTANAGSTFFCSPNAQRGVERSVAAAGAPAGKRNAHRRGVLQRSGR